MPEKEIMIIGSAEVVKPFIALGVNCQETQDAEKALALIKQVAQEQKVGLLFIAEKIAEQIMPEIEALKTKELPAVLILPEYGSKQQLGMKRLQMTMAKAIGKKI